MKRIEIKSIVLLLIALTLCLTNAQLIAHPLSLSKCKLYLNPNRITAQLEIPCEEYFLYYGLEPDNDNYLKPTDINKSIKRHESFLLEYFSILNKDGHPYTGTVISVTPFTIPEKGVSVDEMMQFTTQYTIEYQSDDPLEFITIVQDFGGQESYIPAIMNLEIWQSNVLIDHLSDLGKSQPCSLRLDWKNPPIPLSADKQEKRQRLLQQADQTMGISSYSSIYSFIYADPYEVCHEILIPLLTLETFMDIPRKDKTRFEIDEQNNARKIIGDIFSMRNAITIDGIRVTPTVQRIDFYGMDFTDFAMQAPQKSLSAMNARVGIILAYSTKGTYSHFRVNWDMVNASARMMRSVIFTPHGTEKFTFSRYRRQFEWTNPSQPDLPEIASVSYIPQIKTRSIPILSILLLIIVGVLLLTLKNPLYKRIIVPILLIISLLTWNPVRITITDPFQQPQQLTESQTKPIVSTLLKNIYRAFDYNQESDIYDALAQSVGGDLLDKLYLLIHQGRIMTEQGGAISRIEQVDMLDGSLVSQTQTSSQPPQFIYRTRWKVIGTVEHWGHIHERTHEYDAAFTIQAGENHWQIVNFEVLNEQRTAYKTRIRI